MTETKKRMTSREKVAAMEELFSKSMKTAAQDARRRRETIKQAFAFARIIARELPEDWKFAYNYGVLEIKKGDQNKPDRVNSPAEFHAVCRIVERVTGQKERAHSEFQNFGVSGYLEARITAPYFDKNAYWEIAVRQGQPSCKVEITREYIPSHYCTVTKVPPECLGITEEAH